MNFKTLILIPLLITLTGCLSGGGYKASLLLNKNSTGNFVTFSHLSEESKSNIQSWLGSYKVKDSWGNYTFNIAQVDLSIVNNKVVGEVFPKGWSKPAYRIEFNICYKDNGYFSPKEYRDLGDAVLCTSNSNEYSQFVLGKTKATTMVKKENEELFSSILYSGSFVTVNDAPYVMKIKIWNDAPEPVLSLEKIH
ncbi:hypothetical protein [Acinetobacter seifertii]|uniref:hypothetical protein n=1 Tax=Acinetobacter seifertii TaxID=1530123 RepID=UPI00124FCAC2|nr:hypothetical protein [Acinetobacter seifertii]